MNSNHWLKNTGRVQEDVCWEYDLRPSLASHIRHYNSNDTICLPTHLDSIDQQQLLSTFLSSHVEYLTNNINDSAHSLLENATIVTASGTPLLYSRYHGDKLGGNSAIIATSSFYMSVQWITSIFTILNYGDIYAHLIYSLDKEAMNQYRDQPLCDRYMNNLLSIYLGKKILAVDEKFHVYNPFDLIDNYDCAVRFSILHEIGHINALSQRGYSNISTDTDLQYQGGFSALSTWTHTVEETVKWMADQGTNFSEIYIRNFTIDRFRKNNKDLNNFDPVTQAINGESLDERSASRRLVEEFVADSFALDALFSTASSIPTSYRNIYCEAIIKGAAAMLAATLHMQCLKICELAEEYNDEIKKKIEREVRFFHHRCLNLMTCVCKLRVKYELPVIVVSTAFNYLLYRAQSFALIHKVLLNNRVLYYILGIGDADINEETTIKLASYQCLAEMNPLVRYYTLIDVDAISNDPDKERKYSVATLPGHVKDYIRGVQRIVRQEWERTFDFGHASSTERLGFVLSVLADRNE